MPLPILSDERPCGVRAYAACAPLKPTSSSSNRLLIARKPRPSSTPLGFCPRADRVRRVFLCQAPGYKPRAREFEFLRAVDPAEYDRIFNQNTRGLFFTLQEALKLMRDITQARTVRTVV